MEELLTQDLWDGWKEKFEAVDKDERFHKECSFHAWNAFYKMGKQEGQVVQDFIVKKLGFIVEEVSDDEEEDDEDDEEDEDGDGEKEAVDDIIEEGLSSIFKEGDDNVSKDIEEKGEEKEDKKDDGEDTSKDDGNCKKESVEEVTDTLKKQL